MQSRIQSLWSMIVLMFILAILFCPRVTLANDREQFAVGTLRIGPTGNVLHDVVASNATETIHGNLKVTGTITGAGTNLYTTTGNATVNGNLTVTTNIVANANITAGGAITGATIRATSSLTIGTTNFMTWIAGQSDANGTNTPLSSYVSRYVGDNLFGRAGMTNWHWFALTANVTNAWYSSGAIVAP